MCDYHEINTISVCILFLLYLCCSFLVFVDFCICLLAANPWLPLIIACPSLFRSICQGKAMDENIASEYFYNARLWRKILFMNIFSMPDYGGKYLARALFKYNALRLKSARIFFSNNGYLGKGREGGRGTSWNERINSEEESSKHRMQNSMELCEMTVFILDVKYKSNINAKKNKY